MHANGAISSKCVEGESLMHLHPSKKTALAGDSSSGKRYFLEKSV